MLWLTRHRRTPQDRRSWRLVAGALWMFTCANLVWFYYLDSAVSATAAGALVLVFVLLPALAASAVPPLHRLLALSYLLFSVAQAGALGGVLRRGAWTPALGWVLGAMVLSFVSNLGPRCDPRTRSAVRAATSSSCCARA